MSTDPQAKLFYGYLQPQEDKDTYNAEVCDNENPDFETAWSKISYEESHGCVGGTYGYDCALGFFLAVEESLHEADWDKVKVLTPQDLTIKPEWDEQLRLAAQTFGLDISLLQPSWHLVCLYF